MKNHLQQKQMNIILCRYLMSTIWTFDGIENKNDVYWDTES